ncbi:MIZ zinc finger family protein [Tritrichomonas foetus]|uniref:MIZ zinc finger family protein n=1 Tax=Tritrichomonas foetus TaxID=1144522 RepID=A0A1J4L3N1_9EUKA|nr:MIZ zinc finger family protein [Tritrichomonas foetus]|eukprot:OHT16580.1 MIZ zinc finger family protein [Tritrichomonas foetus]
MSFDRNSPQTEFGVSKAGKPKLRSVRLELPQNEFLNHFSPNPPHYSLPVQFTPGVNNQISSPQLSIQPPSQTSVASVANGGTLLSASILHTFPSHCEPSFACDIMTPNNAMPFTTQPPPSLLHPRFFLYSVSVNPVPQTHVKFIVNGKIINHFNTDHQPLDITDILLPFGQQNWLIVESGNIVVPFAVVGVWVSMMTMEELIQTIESKSHFILNEVATPCPITGAPIEIPAKGLQCNHQQCFDLVSYITLSQALNRWVCPVCRQQLPLDDLRVGVANQISSEARDNQASSPGIVWEESTTFFEDNDDFWTM